ncbi:MAG: hypothetical protein ACI93R_000026 [Flavobacteriales bacterium]|jgi:uncharacterized protein YaeQ
MALGATIYKVDLSVSDFRRDYYQTHALRIALHPSETQARMMLRVLAFSLHADERLDFGKGLSSDDEPDLWQRNLNGNIDHWIDLGLPSEKRIRQACGKAESVSIFCYGDRSVNTWWQKIAADLERFDKLSVYRIGDDQLGEIAKLVQRNMQLQCTIEDSELWLGDGKENLHITLNVLKKS